MNGLAVFKNKSEPLPMLDTSMAMVPKGEFRGLLPEVLPRENRY